MKMEVKRSIFEVFGKFQYLLVEVASDGTRISAINVTKTAAMTLIMPDLKSDDEKRYTLSIPKLLKIVRRAKSSDKIIIDFNENTLKITIQGKFKRTFTMPYESIDNYDVLRADSINLDGFVKIEADPKEFIEIVRDVTTINSDYFRISASKIGVEVTSESMTMEYKMHPDWFVNIDDDTTASTAIGLDVFGDVEPYFKIGGETSIFVEDNAPLIVNGYIEGYPVWIAVAPRADV